MFARPCRTGSADNNCTPLALLLVFQETGYARVNIRLLERVDRAGLRRDARQARQSSGYLNLHRFAGVVDCVLGLAASAALRKVVSGWGGGCVAASACRAHTPAPVTNKPATKRTSTTSFTLLISMALTA